MKVGIDQEKMHNTRGATVGNEGEEEEEDKEKIMGKTVEN